MSLTVYFQQAGRWSAEWLSAGSLQDRRDLHPNFNKQSVGQQSDSQCGAQNKRDLQTSSNKQTVD